MALLPAASLHLAVRKRRLLKEVTLALCVTLLPSRMADIYEGIRANAYELLMRYHEEAGGVILALSDIRFPDGQHPE
jgi:hypothetical protein